MVEISFPEKKMEFNNVCIALANVDFSQGEYSILLNKRVIE
jgi:hypothetical protein